MTKVARKAVKAPGRLAAKKLAEDGLDPPPVAASPPVRPKLPAAKLPAAKLPAPKLSPAGTLPAATSPATPAKKPGKKGKAAVPANVSSLLLTATLDAAREKYNDNQIVAAGEASSLLIGVEVPLGMRFILQNNVWPLSRIVELVGLEKSNKSTLAFEVARWFRAAGGVTKLFENETKYSEDMAQSIIGYADETGEEVFGHIPCYSLEDWQGKLEFAVQSDKGLMVRGVFQDVNGKKKQVLKPIGCTIPMCYILDSLAGGICEENIKRIADRGHGGRSHPAEALANTQYFKKLRADLAKWPFSFIIVNHLKKQKAEKGNHVERKTPGGKHVSFQESFQLELSKVRSLSYVDTRPNAPTLTINGNRISIQCRRSGMGEDMRKLDVDVLWWYDRSPVDGRPRQYTKWQWSAAIVDLLLGQKGIAVEKLRAIVDIRAAKNGLFWSSTLGISRQAPLTKADFGEVLEANPVVSQQISDLLSVKQRTVMRKGDDYRQLIANSAAKMMQRLKQ